MKIKFEDFSEAEEMLIEIVNFMRYEADRELRKEGDFIALREAIVVAFDEWWTAKHKMTKMDCMSCVKFTHYGGSIEMDEQLKRIAEAHAECVRERGHNGNTGN